jgi:hypothetical protein
MAYTFFLPRVRQITQDARTFSPAMNAVGQSRRLTSRAGLAMSVGERIAFDYGHFAVVIGQSPSR